MMRARDSFDRGTELNRSTVRRSERTAQCFHSTARTRISCGHPTKFLHDKRTTFTLGILDHDTDATLRMSRNRVDAARFNGQTTRLIQSRRFSNQSIYSTYRKCNSVQLKETANNLHTIYILTILQSKKGDIARDALNMRNIAISIKR